MVCTCREELRSSPAPSSHLSTGVKVAYLSITYILWGSFCYTGINIPYGSMASAISADPGDRQSLSTFRTMGGMLAQLTMQNMAGYVYPNYYNSPEAQSASTAVMMVGMMVAAVVAKPLGKKFGKAEVSVVSNIFAAAVNLVLFFLRPANVWVYIGMQTLSWLGLGIFSMVSWALITDVIDDAELKNGIREDGSVYAIYSWARKLGQAASAGLTGWLLTLIGYTADSAFDPAVTKGIYDISVLVPVLGFGLLAAVLWFWYPLHKKQVDANVAALEEKRKSE